MTDDPLDRAVDARIDAFRPDMLPPFSAIEGRKRARDRRRMAVGAGALSVVALVGVGGLIVSSLTGGGDTLTSGTGPHGDFAASGPTVACNSPEAAFRVGLLSGRPTDLSAGDEADRALLRELQDDRDFGAGEGRLPVTDWFRVVSRDDYAAWVRSPDRQTAVASVEFGRQGGTWSYLRSAPAGCPLRLTEPGAEFAPVQEAKVTGSTLDLLAASGTCGAGSRRVERVEVAETDTAVTVIVRLQPESRPEGVFCAGTGVSVPARVDLKQALGARILLDGSEVPAVRVRTRLGG